MGFSPAASPGTARMGRIESHALAPRRLPRAVGEDAGGRRQHVRHPARLQLAASAGRLHRRRRRGRGRRGGCAGGWRGRERRARVGCVSRGPAVAFDLQTPRRCQGCGSRQVEAAGAAGWRVGSHNIAGSWFGGYAVQEQEATVVGEGSEAQHLAICAPYDQHGHGTAGDWRVLGPGKPRAPRWRKPCWCVLPLRRCAPAVATGDARQQGRIDSAAAVDLCAPADGCARAASPVQSATAGGPHWRDDPDRT